MIWRLSALLAMMLLGAWPALAQDAPLSLVPSTEPVTPDTLLKLESLIVMPSAAEAHNEYYRFYAAARSEGDDTEFVVGIFVAKAGTGERLRRRSLASGAVEVLGVADAFVVPSPNDLPVVYDGACTVVNVIFDRSSESFMRLGELRPYSADGYCNGPYSQYDF